MKIGVIVSQFNRSVTDKLLEGTLETLRRQDIAPTHIEVIKVPGCFELPLAAKKMAGLKRFDALVCLGTVIRGETSHYDLVCREAAQGIREVSQEFELPIGFGVLTCENLEQALNRAGGKYGNKGIEAAQAALDMVKLLGGMT